MQKIFGIGIDILKTPRIQTILSSRTSSRFIKKVLSSSEIKSCEILFPEYKENPQMLEKLSQFVANRWATKEAIVKALNKKDLEFTKVSIEKSKTGKPEVVFDLEYWEMLGKPHFEISITHDGEITAVVALCLKD